MSFGDWIDAFVSGLTGNSSRRRSVWRRRSGRTSSGVQPLEQHTLLSGATTDMTAAAVEVTMNAWMNLDTHPQVITR